MFFSPATSPVAGQKPGLLRRAMRAVAAVADAVRAVSRRAAPPRRSSPPASSGLGWARLDGFARSLLQATAVPAWALEDEPPPVTAEILAMAAAFEREVIRYQLSLRDPGRHHLARRLASRRRLVRPAPTLAQPRPRPAPLPERGLPPPLASPLLI